MTAGSSGSAEAVRSEGARPSAHPSVRPPVSPGEASDPATLEAPRRSAPERSYDWIRAALLDRRFAAGDALREEELAEIIGVSRTPVREALRRLAAEGLIDVVPNRGAFVPSFGEEELEAIFGLRLRLESYGARLAAAHVGPDDVARMLEIATDMERLVSGRDWRQNAASLSALNGRFHRTIFEATKHPRLSQMAAGAMQMVLVNQTFRTYSDADMQRSLHHHRELAEALSRHDAEWAEAVMRAHLLAARRVMLEARVHAARGEEDSPAAAGKRR